MNRIKELKEMLRTDPQIAHQIIGEVVQACNDWHNLKREVNDVINESMKLNRQIRNDMNQWHSDRLNQIKRCWLDCDRDTDKLKKLIMSTSAYKFGFIDEVKLNALVYQDASSGCSFHEVMRNLYSIVKYGKQETRKGS